MLHRGFGTICSLGHPLRVLEHTPVDEDYCVCTHSCATSHKPTIEYKLSVIPYCIPSTWNGVCHVVSIQYIFVE